MNSRVTSSDLLGFLWVVRRGRVAPSAPPLGPSLPGAPATHFIASFRPDDYLALYEGHRRGPARSGFSSPLSEAPKHPAVRILHPRVPPDATTFLRRRRCALEAALSRIERCLSGRITTRLIPYKFSRSAESRDDGIAARTELVSSHGNRRD